MKSAADTVRRKVEASPAGTFFRTSDFPGSRSAVETHLSRLVSTDPSLLRVRRGLYWKGGRSKYGSGKPDVDAIVRAVASDQSVGPPRGAAGHALGLSTQVPATPAYAVVGAPPTGIPGVKFHSRRNLKRIGLNYHEVALLEVLRDWPDSVEANWVTLVLRVARLRNEGLLRPEQMRSAVAGEHAPALRERFDQLMVELSGFRNRSAAGRA